MSMASTTVSTTPPGTPTLLTKRRRAAFDTTSLPPTLELVQQVMPLVHKYAAVIDEIRWEDRLKVTPHLAHLLQRAVSVPGRRTTLCGAHPHRCVCRGACRWLEPARTAVYRSPSYTRHPQTAQQSCTPFSVSIHDDVGLVPNQVLRPGGRKYRRHAPPAKV